MKKVILFATTILVMGTTQAQFKPDGGTFGMEVQFRPLGNAPISLSTDVTGNAFGIAPRYFLTEKWELRVDLVVGFSSERDEATDATIGPETEVTKDNAISFGIDLGVNYHFNGTERISPYVGAMIGFGIANQKRTISDWGYISGDSFKAKGGAWYMGFAVATGFNWHIVHGLYIGAEVGLGLAFSKDTKFVTETKIGSTTNTVTTDPTASTFGLGFIVNPAIRLGWKF